MGVVKLAVMLYCGFYYDFRDDLICSHHAHITPSASHRVGMERDVLCNREPTTPAVFGIRLIQRPHPKNRRGVAHQVSGHLVIIEHYHIG